MLCSAKLTAAFQSHAAGGIETILMMKSTDDRFPAHS
jgi:hypothetical protein